MYSWSCKNRKRHNLKCGFHSLLKNVCLTLENQRRAAVLLVVYRWHTPLPKAVISSYHPQKGGQTNMDFKAKKLSAFPDMVREPVLVLTAFSGQHPWNAAVHSTKSRMRQADK